VIDPVSGMDTARAMAGLLAVTPDPLAEIKLRRQLVREAYKSGEADGWRRGYEDAETDMARRWNKIAAPIARGGPLYEELVRRRLTVWGEQRDWETFGQPHPNDRMLPGPGM
jgi:hypothetical protein